jgi:uncharacterized protein (DUF302 family)
VSETGAAARINEGTNEMQNNYGFGKTVTHDFATAVTRVTDELGKQGFGVLTEIDVQATLKKKLDKDVPPYRILGACNPNFAHQVLDLEPTVGLLLPCNVVVRQDAQGVQVEFMDPGLMVKMIDKPEVQAIAGEVRERLLKVMAAV